MRFLQPAGLLVGLLAVPIVILHMLRPRRRPVEVSSTYLWREIAEPVSAASPWQRPPLTAPLVMQLLAVALLALAAAMPVRSTSTPLAPHTVFVVDASASMGAKDGQPDRLALAKAQARRLRRQLPIGGVASLVVAGQDARVAVSASPDRRAFEDALAAVRLEGGDGDFASAFVLAESLETPGLRAGFVLLSDGRLSDEERVLIPAGTRYVRTGKGEENAAVRRVAVETRGDTVRVRTTVANTGKNPIERRLRVEGAASKTVSVRVEPGSTAQRTVDLPAGSRVTARLLGPDLLASDDTGYAMSGGRREVRVLLAGAENVFLDRLLAAIPGVTVERSPVSRTADGFDLAIYDGVVVPAEAGAPILAIAPPTGAPGVSVAGEVEGPVVTLVRSADALLDGLDVSDVGIAAAQRIEAPTDEVLIGAEDAPLLVRGIRDGRPFAYLAFALEDSNLPLQLAFPVLGDRLVAELAGVGPRQSDLRVGQALPLALPQRVTVRDPSGTSTIVEPDGVAPRATRAGFWTITEPGKPDRVVAVNGLASESTLKPAQSLPIRQAAATPGAGAKREASLLRWLALAVVVVVALELAMTLGVTGVSRRRRHVALGVRVAMVLLLVAALTGVSLSRPSRHVATLFLVDGSDSMGAAGRASAQAFVTEALKSKPEGDLAGVASFAADARVEQHLDEGAERTPVQLDRSRTDLARALRLAHAVLPPDARRRVVVVSDGRLNGGDALAEAKSLREAGVRVDVHPIERRGTADIAVTRLDAPSRAGEGEAMTLKATVTATNAGTVRLTLRRNGEVIDERTLEAVAGDTPVEIPTPPVTEGTHRFSLTVSGANDGVPENDVAHAAVRVAGRPRVLLVEGVPGNAAALVGALQAGGLLVDVVAPSGIPPLERLAEVSSIVLVDVDRRTLSAAQEGAIAGAVRDLGRGLVTIGGDRSYALGGYLGSELERVLPVRSEAREPKRRASIAEVLVVDASGSMEETKGAIRKVDIARAGAVRAARALREQDQLGILASS